MRLWVVRATAGLLLLVSAAGCSRESTRLALRSQQRANLVQQTVVERQHEALCVLLYRDLVQRLAGTGVAMTDERRAVVNAVWNDRDLIEFWRVQQERTAALRLVGVDAGLYGAQAPADLLWKSLSARLDRLECGLAQAKIAEEYSHETD